MRVRSTGLHSVVSDTTNSSGARHRDGSEASKVGGIKVHERVEADADTIAKRVLEDPHQQGAKLHVALGLGHISVDRGDNRTRRTQVADGLGPVFREERERRHARKI